MAVDNNGAAYLVGTTLSSESSFPVSVGPDLIYNGDDETYIAKVNANGQTLDYAGYIGGAQEDFGWAVAVDSSGNAYVAGDTSSTEASFPDGDGFGSIPGFDQTYSAGYDAFLVKVNASGTAIDYASFLGGSGRESGWAVAVDINGNAYLSGRTRSAEFPFTGAPEVFPVTVGPDITFNGATMGGTNTNGEFDAYVAKFTPSGTSLMYAGYIGGLNDDRPQDIAVDADGSLYVAGYTANGQSDFPVALGPDLTYNDSGAGDGFIAKVNPSGTGLVYAGYIGGSSFDLPHGIAVDASGNAFVTGVSSSDETTFPDGDGFGALPGYDQSYGGGPIGDGFVVGVSSQPAFVKLGGRVTTPSGTGIRDLQVKVTDELGNVYFATTSSFGVYSFSVEAGGTYTITVTSKRYRFTPQVITLHEPNLSVDLQALE